MGKNAITERTRLEIESIVQIDPDTIPEIQPGLAFYRE
jgi:hypothetical protein